jgi:putative restriction endonuclease
VHSTAEQAAIRQDIFVWLDNQVASNFGVLSRRVIESYHFHGSPLKLANPGRGIWNPKSFDSSLSILHTYSGPYDDTLTDGSYLRYHYEASDPDAGSNRKLRKAARDGVPLVYFHGIAEGLYLPYYPVFIVEDRYDERVVIVALDKALVPSLDSAHDTEIQRTYIERIVRTRVHQREFRQKIILAYDYTCAVCRLNNAELLDAAHITLDSSMDGIAFTPNGLALCKLHHAAYDRNLLGIDQNHRIHIAQRVLDGPASGALNSYFREHLGRSLHVPKARRLRPDCWRLAARFEQFRERQLS